MRPLQRTTLYVRVVGVERDVFWMETLQKRRWPSVGTGGTHYTTGWATPSEPIRTSVPALRSQALWFPWFSNLSGYDRDPRIARGMRYGINESFDCLLVGRIGP